MAHADSRPSQEQFWRTPLDLDRLKIPHGQVRIITERCKGCEFCVEYCPRGVLAMSSSFNRKGYHYPEAVKSGSCVDCNLCSMICPEFAIFAETAEPQSVAQAEEEAKGSCSCTDPAPVAPKGRRKTTKTSDTKNPRSIT